MSFTQTDQRNLLAAIRSPGCKRFLPEKEREGWTDRQRETHIQAQKIFPKPLSIDKVHTSKSLVSGENSFRHSLTVNSGLLPNWVLLSSSTENIPQETEVFFTARAQCSFIFYLPLCVFKKEKRLVKVNIWRSSLKFPCLFSA